MAFDQSTRPRGHWSQVPENSERVQKPPSIFSRIPTVYSSSAKHTTSIQLPQSLPTMVAINGREVLHHVVSNFYARYGRYLVNLFRGQPAVLGRSSSLLHSKQIAKNRKNGRTQRRQYNDLASIPNASIKSRGVRKKKARGEGVDDLQGDYDAIDSGPKSTDEVQFGGASQGRSGPRSDPRKDAEHRALVEREFKTLKSTKAKVEERFEAEVISEQMEAQTTKEKTRSKKEKDDAAGSPKMRELERREEKERADRGKETRLAQLEAKIQTARSALAREKLARKQSKLRMVFTAQEERRKEEQRQRQLRAEDARLASQHRDKLLRENLVLEDYIREVGSASRQTRAEKEEMKQKLEEERSKRLRAEGSLDRWKEKARESLPGAGQPQAQEQELPQQQPPVQEKIPPVKAQFELYEKKWEIIQSGVDISGSEVHDICFSQMPWPVVDIFPTKPDEIQPDHIEEFLTHPLRVQFCGGYKTTEEKLIDELKKWHPDRFNLVVLPKVWEQDRQAVSDAAGMIAGVLTAMLLAG